MRYLPAQENGVLCSSSTAVIVSIERAGGKHHVTKLPREEIIMALLSQAIFIAQRRSSCRMSRRPGRTTSTVRL